MQFRIFAVTLLLVLEVPCFAHAQDSRSSAASADSAAVASAPVARNGSDSAAPMRISPGAKLFIPRDEFGMALAAAIIKKAVQVVVTSDSLHAEFFVQTISHATKEGGAERVVKVLAFGWGAGSGKHFDATVTISNRDGAMVFAFNSKKENFQSAAENIAKNLKKHIEGS